MRKLHFLSGFPRAGSTLLAAILNQNPAFTAGMASPVARVYQGLEATMSQLNEAAVFIDDDYREAMLRAAFTARYSKHEGVAFDNHRMWLARLPALSLLFPDSKVIACVRDVAWIIDSFERLKHTNPLQTSAIHGHDTGGTVFDRALNLQGGRGVVGFSLNALREAMAGEHADRILLVEYDDLCADPAGTLETIYAFIDEPLFEHDFNNVQYSASEFDNRLGDKGMHDIGGKVEVRKRKTILPPGIFASYANDQFWRQSKPKSASIHPMVKQ